jgi:hypothetical protein
MMVGLVLMLVSGLSPSPAPMMQQAPASTTQSNWEADLKRRRDALVARNGPGTDAALRDQLLAMADQDQAARGFHHDAGTDPKQIAVNLAEVDQQLTEQMKAIVAKRGWPTIGLVGIKASNAAMLVLTHTADHAWQGAMLAELEGLADAGKIDGSALALVIDKELVARGQLQRYGSQFKLVNGEMAMFAVEDPAGLDRRRADALLPPMDVYRKVLMDLYHFKISNQIVAPIVPKQ